MSKTEPNEEISSQETEESFDASNTPAPLDPVAPQERAPHICSAPEEHKGEITENIALYIVDKNNSKIMNAYIKLEYSKYDMPVSLLTDPNGAVYLNNSEIMMVFYPGDYPYKLNIELPYGTYEKEGSIHIEPNQKEINLQLDDFSKPDNKEFPVSIAFVDENNVPCVNKYIKIYTSLMRPAGVDDYKYAGYTDSEGKIYLKTIDSDKCYIYGYKDYYNGGTNDSYVTIESGLSEGMHLTLTLKKKAEK